MHETVEFLLRHGYWVLFLWVLAEQLGAPIPSVPVILAMGALIGLGQRSFVPAVALIFAAAIMADSVWYVLGRKRGYAVLRTLCRISIEPDSCVNATRAWFTKAGPWALLTCKFIPGFGGIASPMSGLQRMRWWIFLTADGAGILLWSVTYLGVGYLFREQLEDVSRLAARFGGGLLAIAALLALWLAWKFWQRRRFYASLRVARITPEEARERMDDFLFLDLRSPKEIDWDGEKISGALWFDREELSSKVHLIPRDRDLILYCT